MSYALALPPPPQGEQLCCGKRYYFTKYRWQLQLKYDIKGFMKNDGTPFPVRDCLKALGRDISIARRRRRFSVRDFAERLQVGAGTVARLERGDPGVSIKTLAMAFLALGEIDKLAATLDCAKDDTGLLLANRQLPKRIRSVKKTANNAPLKRGIEPEGVGF